MRSREVKPIPENLSQSGSESATRLREVGIASNRGSALVAVNTFPGLVHTARHTMEVCCTRSRSPNRKGGAVHGVADDWGEVVTR